MKFILFCFCLLGFTAFAAPNNLELIAVKNEDSAWELDYTLSVKNNGTKPATFLKSNEYSFMNAGAPAIEFVAETFVEGKWKKFKDPKVPQIDYFVSKVEDYIITIKPGETIEIGHLYRNRGLSLWFNLLDDASLKVYFIYRIEASESAFFGKENDLKKFGITPITLTSNKIDIEFKNTRSPKKYQEAKNYYLHHAFREHIEKKYTSTQFLKSMKKIKNTNGVNKDILSEVLEGERYKFVSDFNGKTKDGYNYRGIFYETRGKLHLCIYAGKHYFSKKKEDNQPLEYLFGEIAYDPALWQNYLFKN